MDVEGDENGISQRTDSPRCDERTEEERREELRKNLKYKMNRKKCEDRLEALKTTDSTK